VPLFLKRRCDRTPLPGPALHPPLRHAAPRRAGGRDHRGDPGGGGRGASRAERERRRVGPEVGPTSALYSCTPTGMHWRTCIFLTNLTAFSVGLIRCASLVNVRGEVREIEMRAAAKVQATPSKPGEAEAGIAIYGEAGAAADAASAPPSFHCRDTGRHTGAIGGADRKSLPPPPLCTHTPPHSATQGLTAGCAKQTRTAWCGGWTGCSTCRRRRRPRPRRYHPDQPSPAQSCRRSGDRAITSPPLSAWGQAAVAAVATAGRRSNL
jgi:hypothetical protein